MHKQSKEDEEMNKILTALKYFNDKNNHNVKDESILDTSDPVNGKSIKQNQENERANSTTKDGESRPRTSRGKRGSKPRKKS